MFVPSPDSQNRQLSQWDRWWCSGEKESPSTQSLHWGAFMDSLQSFTRNVPASRGTGSGPEIVTPHFLGVLDSPPPSYLAHTSGSTSLLKPCSASQDSPWRLGWPRGPSAPPQAKASRAGAGPWLFARTQRLRLVSSGGVGRPSSVAPLLVAAKLVWGVRGTHSRCKMSFDGSSNVCGWFLKAPSHFPQAGCHHRALH